MQHSGLVSEISGLLQTNIHTRIRYYTQPRTMISKCIRRLSFRSLANEKSPLDVVNDSCNAATTTTTTTTQQCLPAPVAVKPSSWTSCLWDKMSVSPVPSRKHHHQHQMPVEERQLAIPMLCKVYLQQYSDTYVLSVVIHRSDRAVHGQQGDVVASSAVSTNIHPGALSLEVQSTVLEGQLMRVTEQRWRGTDIEKQFVLKSKVGSVEGFIGRVVVRHTDLDTTLFELNLLKRGSPTPPADLAWGAAGFKELAALLNLVDENEDFERLARDLGFTEYELTTRLLPAKEPFSALLETYQSRRGTPEELIRAMYSCSRVRSLGTVGACSASPLSSMISQCSSLGGGSTGRLLSTPVDPELDELEEAAKLPRTPSRKRKSSDSSSPSNSPKRSRTTSEETADYDLDFCDAATIPVGDIEFGVDESALPPTPPATPLKRLSGPRDPNNMLDSANVFNYS